MRLILLWLLNACALLAVAYLMPSSIQVASFATAMIAALLLGLVNVVLRPVLVLLKVTVVFTQAVSFGLMVKPDSPARLTTMGRMVRVLPSALVIL